jgi:hypothetical protein
MKMAGLYSEENRRLITASPSPPPSTQHHVDPHIDEKVFPQHSQPQTLRRPLFKLLYQLPSVLCFPTLKHMDGLLRCDYDLAGTSSARLALTPFTDLPPCAYLSTPQD